MATWCMLKTEKMRNQAKQARFGSYIRRSENATKLPAAREGKSYYVAPSRGVVVGSAYGPALKSEAGKAQGLAQDIGRVGKGNRVASTSCRGDGRRRPMGLTADMFSTEVELLVAVKA